MRQNSWWPSFALLAGLSIACQDRPESELEPSSASPHRIPDSYALIDIGVLEGDNFSYPMSVNGRGEVTGMSDTSDGFSYRGFYWNDDDGITDLGIPAGYAFDEVWADEISDLGVVVGTLSGGGEYSRGFLWYNGAYQLIEPPYGATYTEAYGINRSGLIVGATEFTPGGYEAFLLSGGEFMPLGVAEGGTWSVAIAVNARGDIIGFGDDGLGGEVGLLWVNGGAQMIDLRDTSSIPDFLPNAIAQGGHLVGYSPSLDHAVLVGVGGQATDLESLAGFSGYSSALGVNRFLQVVGGSSTDELAYHAFLWEGGVMVDLNTLIDPAMGVELVEATDINDNGEITAVGLVGAEYRAFLLRPE